MGFGNPFEHLPIVKQVKFVKNVIEEGSLVEGVKRTYKEDIQENVITGHFYRMGEGEGKKEGYVEASYEYEEKLKKQAEEFLKQKKIAEDQFENYERLIKAYNELISELRVKVNKTEQEKLELKELMSTRNQLELLVC